MQQQHRGLGLPVDNPDLPLMRQDLQGVKACSKMVTGPSFLRNGMRASNGIRILLITTYLAI